MGLASLLRRRMDMLREDATAVARVVEDAFAGHSEVEDDLLDPELRQVFYDLQDANVLQVDRHEYHEDGRLMRGYRWSVAEEKAGPEITVAEPEIAAEPDVYAALEETAWTRRPSAPA